jgi:CHAD domain-containing protein
MLLTKSLTNYTDSLEARVQEMLPGILDLDVDAVHDFRVALKKTRTVLNFLNYWTYGRTSKKAVTNIYQPVFKKIGKIRELHVHKELVPKLADLSGLDILFLDKKINYQLVRNEPFIIKDVKAFKRKVPGLFKKIRTQINNAPKGQVKMDAPESYQVKLDRRIKREVASGSPDLHKVRRILKQQIFIFDALQESELLSFYQEFRAEWKILESTMGAWHDQVMFHDWLIPGLQWKRLSDEQYKTMMKLISYLRSTNGRMERELIKTMKGK